MDQKKMFIGGVILLGLLLAFGAGTYMKTQNESENSLYAKESAADKIVGLDGQSTRFNVDEENLAAPSDMKVQGLDNQAITQSTQKEETGGQGEVTGLSGLSIE